MSQIATSLSEMRGNEGRIPASIKPPDIANISQITLRSGREYKGPTMKIDEREPTMASEEKDNMVQQKENTGAGDDPFFLSPGTEVETEEAMKETGEFTKGESSNTALKLPLFSKFIKEFIAVKTNSDGKIVIGESVSAVIQKRRLPSKRTDPGVRLVNTNIVIQLADRSCISPEGVLENVIGKVHDFLYPADFHVIKMSENESVESSGVLLGRPFLRTTKTIIDVFYGTICLDYHGEKFTFIIDESMRKPLDVENLHAVDIINPLVQEYLETELLHQQIDNSEMSHSIDKEVVGWCEAMNTQKLTDEKLAEAIKEFCKNPTSARSKGSAYLASMEKLPDLEDFTKKEMEKNPLPQEASSPKKELTTLPPGLKYGYLEENETFSVIINNNLTQE
ncbi:uncharacterized protein LOC121760489 [Salvia splendens]|uniref:uncharacterized protein LOC121760489 n=1 Tax=Salvia splendens TaxID=180675 RepID=UPI001C277449|nr:uncharacterized protein LOC121760489 [Salvia splendens]